MPTSTSTKTPTSTSTSTSMMMMRGFSFQFHAGLSSSHPRLWTTSTNAFKRVPSTVTHSLSVFLFLSLSLFPSFSLSLLYFSLIQTPTDSRCFILYNIVHLSISLSFSRSFFLSFSHFPHPLILFLSLFLLLCPFPSLPHFFALLLSIFLFQLPLLCFFIPLFRSYSLYQCSRYFLLSFVF